MACISMTPTEKHYFEYIINHISKGYKTPDFLITTKHTEDLTKHFYFNLNKKYFCLVTEKDVSYYDLT